MSDKLFFCATHRGWILWTGIRRTSFVSWWLTPWGSFCTNLGQCPIIWHLLRRRLWRWRHGASRRWGPTLRSSHLTRKGSTLPTGSDKVGLGPLHIWINQKFALQKGQKPTWFEKQLTLANGNDFFAVDKNLDLSWVNNVEVVAFVPLLDNDLPRKCYNDNTGLVINPFLSYPFKQAHHGDPCKPGI